MSKIFCNDCRYFVYGKTWHTGCEIGAPWSSPNPDEDCCGHPQNVGDTPLKANVQQYMSYKDINHNNNCQWFGKRLPPPPRKPKEPTWWDKVTRILTKER